MPLDEDSIALSAIIYTIRRDREERDDLEKKLMKLLETVKEQNQGGIALWTYEYEVSGTVEKVVGIQDYRTYYEVDMPIKIDERAKTLRDAVEAAVREMEGKETGKEGGVE